MPISVDPKLVETVTAPTNIAVIKYWGKEDVALNTPINSSVSLTLDQVCAWLHDAAYVEVVRAAIVLPFVSTYRRNLCRMCCAR
jgi:hypothetical protein